MWSMVTKSFSKTGLFGRLEVIKFAFEMIRNNSQEELIYITQKGDGSIILQQGVITLFVAKHSFILESGWFQPNRMELNIFLRTFETDLQITFKNPAVTLFQRLTTNDMNTYNWNMCIDIRVFYDKIYRINKNN